MGPIQEINTSQPGVEKEKLTGDDRKKYFKAAVPAFSNSKTTADHIKKGMEEFLGPMMAFPIEIKENAEVLKDTIKEEKSSKVAVEALKSSFKLLQIGLVTAAVTPIWLSISPVTAPVHVIITAARFAKRD